MKIKLTPFLSYVFALWKNNRYREGVGVCGDIAGLFAKLCLEHNITARMLYKKDCVYFYHSKLKKFFVELEKYRLQRFKYINDYSASYFAGLFEVGGFDENGVYVIGDDVDDLILQNLRFYTFKIKNKIYIKKWLMFVKFIKPFVIKKQDEITNFLSQIH